MSKNGSAPLYTECLCSTWVNNCTAKEFSNLAVEQEVENSNSFTFLSTLVFLKTFQSP